ncbi:hypothetical protein lerEdw1_018760 [Lerista edwardsae]|nr:hypothetical protein lerEdw1_018760 [Lerista edwardsae]
MLDVFVKQTSVFPCLYTQETLRHFPGVVVRPPSSIQSLAMKNKDETSDTDSGIIVQSGPDSPVSPMKDLTQAMRKQQKVLEEHLEACVQELRRLCLREAELTGILPTEYPLKAGEKPPKVRRRIGAAFRLDEKAILTRGVDPLSTLERDLALQLQIAEAARCLSREENLAKQVRKRRKSAVLKEEKKLKELEEALSEYRLAARRHSSPLTASAPALEGLVASDESFLSDAALVDEEPQVPQNPPLPSKLTTLPRLQPPNGYSAQPLPHGTLEGQAHPPAPEVECSPIQNSPWKETSLDKPYEKPKKSAESKSVPSSPGLMPQPAPSPVTAQRKIETSPCHFVSPQKVEVRKQAGSSAPPTPEIMGRRGQSQLVRVCSSRESLESRGRSALPRRRPTYYTVTVPEYCFSAPKPNPANKPLYHSASEDSNSDVSSISYTTSAGSSSPDISFAKPVALPPREEASLPFPAQVCKGHEAEYQCPCPQKLLSPPGYFPVMEYVSESLLPAGRELCHSRSSFLPGNAAHFAYKEDLVPVRFHRSMVPHSRVMHTPSLKDCPPSGPSGTLQVPRVHILKRSPEGIPVQVYVPENGEIITQV